jgi:hypothetical protein
MQARESCDAISQIPLVYDVIAIKHGSSLVAGKLHCDALRNASPHEVADSSSAKVMRDPPNEFRPHHLPNTALLLMRGPIESRHPRSTEVTNRYAITVKHVRDDPAGRTLQGFLSATLLLE